MVVAHTYKQGLTCLNILASIYEAFLKAFALCYWWEKACHVLLLKVMIDLFSAKRYT